MGISFKVAKTGIRFQPKPPQAEVVLNNSNESSLVPSGNDFSALKRKADATDATNEVCLPVPSICSGGHPTELDHEVSFTLYLFPDGFSIGTAEKSKLQPILHDIPKSLHPYDRRSETLFSAIESGLLPGDILDDIPGKYFEGKIVCEVQDYRKCLSQTGGCGIDGSPVINKVHLRMSLESVVKDIPSISDDTWTYSDLMEVESRILKALQPQLCLDPTPMMDRLCRANKQLDLGILPLRKRLRRAEENVIPINQDGGKIFSMEKPLENASCKAGEPGFPMNISGDQAVQQKQQAHINLTTKYATSTDEQVSPSIEQHYPRQLLSSLSHPKFRENGCPKTTQDRGTESPVNILAANVNSGSAAGSDFIHSFTGTINGSVPFQGKRETLDHQLPSLPNIKRQKQMLVGPDGAIQQQQVVQSLDGLHGTEGQWKNSFLQQYGARALQYANVGGQKYSQLGVNDSRQAVIGGASSQDSGSSYYLGQSGTRCPVKEERFEMDNYDKPELEKNKDNPHTLIAESSQMDQQQLLQHQQFMRPHFPTHLQWQGLGDSRKDETLQKKKSVQSPRIPSVAVVQSPAPSKSGEISNGSIGAHIATFAGPRPQNEKANGAFNATFGSTSVVSSHSDSVQKQASMATKRRSNSLPRSPAISGVASPASVGTSVPLNTSCPSNGTPSDQAILDRFSKIELIAHRHQLNCKKNKVDNYHARKPTAHSTREIKFYLENSLNLEDPKDVEGMSLPKSLVGVSMNVCKSRIIHFRQKERIYQGNCVVPPKLGYKVVLLERPNDGTVAMQYGDIDDVNLPIVQQYGLTLPSTHYADLFAVQLIKLMAREGYQDIDDQVCPLPTSTAPTIPDGMSNEMQFSEAGQAVMGQPSGAVNTANGGNPSINQSPNILPGSRMLPPGSTQGMQMSQGFLPGVGMPSRPHFDQASLQQKQNQASQLHQRPQHQQSQMQRSSVFHPSNNFSHLNAMGQNPNLQMGSHIINNKSSMQQLRMLHMQQQHQTQQQQQHRKLMAAIGMGNMGNVSNNMVGLGNLGNVVGMGSVHGMGPTMSAPMGSMSGLGGMNQNQMNPSQISSMSNTINQQLRSGLQIPQAQAQAQALIASKFKMAQNRGGMMSGPQAGIAGMSGNNQMHLNPAGLSMLNPNLNRATMSPLPRSTMAPMGPPKTQGMNFFMNQQQHLQFQQQPQQQLMQPQQQPLGSPLQQQQSIVSQLPSSAMAIQQQIGSPSQSSLQTPLSPQQLSSGMLQQMNASSGGAAPASPQLSSQTLGSVNSIASSPMDLQAISNKVNNPINNNV